MPVSLGDLFVSIKGDDAQLAKDLARAQVEAKKAGQAMAEDMKRVGREMRELGGMFSTYVTAPLAALGLGAVNEARKLESLQSGLEFVVGSASAAKKQMEELQAMSDRTAQSFGSLAQASLGLTSGFSGNVEEANFVLEQFSALSGKIGVSASDFDRMVVNLTQIGGSTRLAGDELREMSAILPGFRDLLKDAFGTANSEDLAKMGISGRDALKGIAEAIESTGVKADMTLLNSQINATRNEFVKLSLELGPLVLPPLKETAETIREMLAEFRSMTPEAQKFMVAGGVAAAALGPLLMIAGNTTIALGSIPGAIAAVGAAGPLLVPLGVAVGVAAAGVVAYQQDWGGLKKTVDDAVKSIGEHLDAMGKAWQGFYIENKAMLDDLGEMTKWLFGTVLGLGVRYVQLHTTNIMKVFTWLGANVGAVYKKIMEGSVTLWGSFQTLRERIEVAWRSMVGSILDGGAVVLDAMSELSRATPLGVFSDHIGGAADSLRAQAERYRRAGAVASAVVGASNLSIRRAIETINAPAPLPKFGPVYNPGDIVSPGGGNDTRDTRDQQGGGNERGGGNIPGLGSAPSTQELTTSMVRAMGESVKSPGSKAAAACAMFASEVIAKFTKGVTDEGGKINWSARGLVQQVKGLGGQTVPASQAMPGALAYKPGSGPSGMHVGIYLGNGQIMDMNGQRDGRRNTRGVTGTKGWTGFINMPDRLMDPKFKGGPINEDIVEMLQGLEKIDDLFQSASTQFHTEMARRSDPRTPIADKFNISLRDFKALMPGAQAQLKGWYDQLKAVEQADRDAAEGAKLFQEFVNGSAAASAGLGESMTKWAAEEAAANAERAKMQREWILGIQKQIELSADASELTKFQWDREHGLGEAARLTNEEYEERAEALSKLQDHNAELEKSRRFEEALANMVRIRADDEEKAAEAAEAQRQRFLDRLGDMGERLRSLSGLSGEAELKARLLGEGLTETQTEALAAIDLVISRMEEQRAEMERIANAGADALKAGFDRLFGGGGIGGFWDGMVGSFREALNQMLADIIVSRFKAELQGLFKIDQAGVQGAGDAINRAGIPADIGKIVQGIAGFSASFRGFRAEGGPVMAGGGYIVGERGPEYFVPGSDGRVFNQRQMASAGGPQIVVNITIQADNPRQFEGSLGQIQAQIGRAVDRAVRRNSGR